MPFQNVLPEHFRIVGTGEAAADSEHGYGTLGHG